MVKRTQPWKVIKNHAFSRLDGRLSRERATPPAFRHVTDMYADWFKRICGLALPPDLRTPFISIPAAWTNWAEKRFPMNWSRWDGTGPCRRVFINPYAKDKKRCWPLPVVYRYLSELRKRDIWSASQFIINSPPETVKRAAAFFRDHPVDGLVVFTARENFFQLPAVLSRCDFVVSVETSVMHLAASLHVPTLALMRQENPEWAPWNKACCVVITCQAPRDWIADIGAEEVVVATQAFCDRHPTLSCPSASESNP